MAQSRLTTALDSGAVSLPDGPIAVFRPAAGFDLSALPREQVVISHTFRPDYDYWRAAGYAVQEGAITAPTALVVLPRSKVQARALIAAAVATAELVLVDGQREDGIDSIWRDMRAKVPAADLSGVVKAHGRLFWLTRDQIPAGAFEDWAAPVLSEFDGFVTSAGVFSDGAVDRGSALLAAALPEKLPARIADLGAGWGYLSQAILQREGVKTVDLIEAEALALENARQNVTDARAKFTWADATQFKADKAYDAVVMNPPFHIGAKGEPALGRAFITAAQRILHPGGKLWMVANRHLPYEAILREQFHEVSELPGGDGAFKLFYAAKPVRARR
ncbi:class I SAM-dependent methyltransferase [Ketogulonicigenium vulgare]|uniref:Methyltransferase, putative n=1 Tax=Ketogulonicigenium vulgare (strain WSH-001) TaxID=759362 RepID=F9YAA1_KETVW|nr:methyltransferase [Ketogulonicigenium vulgare]ADO42057.1 ribosomal RNA small subunit methyltransferase C RsmC [Ketogulonicigenium vulgare Y25]AEM40274.1 Methyltransferase, putative [Ketogulonicigenium vulgare WSH-001]ALJ80473.1 MFS transporter [Ketogulonicigenium vulgare]ANW33300.1 MFS transporter [Ketogulonicigenium vulgare]AOZ53981.1 ribosomal RNA small subunit methyltransferase C RsmC [Ketogulonicigenium vulgare]